MGLLNEGQCGAGVWFAVGESDVGVEGVAADGFAVGGEPEPVVAVGDRPGVPGVDVLQKPLVVGGFDGGCRLLGGCGEVPHVDVDVGGVEVVAAVGAGDGVGCECFGEGLS